VFELIGWWFTFGQYTQLIAPLLTWAIAPSGQRNLAWLSAFNLILVQLILVVIYRVLNHWNRHRERDARWILRLTISLRLFFLSLLFGMVYGWLDHALNYHGLLSRSGPMGPVFAMSGSAAARSAIGLYMIVPMSVSSAISLILISFLAWKKKLNSLKVSKVADIIFLFLTLTALGMTALFSYWSHPSFNALPEV
jgi:hypothetical protein